MRHSLYANNRKGSHSSVNGRCNRGQHYESLSNVGGSSAKKDKADMILEAKINAVLGKCHDNAEMYAEVQDRVYMYCVNVAIARECKDKEAISRLRKELTVYLNTKL